MRIIFVLFLCWVVDIPASFAAQVEVVKTELGWQILKDGEPYFVKGVCYSGLNEIGKAPQDNTMRDWMVVDDDRDGRIDLAYQTWLDANFNNKQDRNEPSVGDFKLMKDMGVNTIRLYHHASKDPDVQALNPKGLQFNHAPNKKLLRVMYKKTGLMVMMGDFLGAYVIGSGADWQKGTDYRNPAQAANMMRSVHDMVMEFKDEPYILAWAIGNENNLKMTKTNAGTYPKTYARFVDKVAKYIKKLDPDHPVVLVNGETMFLDIYQTYAPNVDIFGVNSYRSWQGFNTLWKEVEAKYGKPVLLTEYGTGHPPVNPKTLVYNETRQARIHQTCWNDIYAHRAGGEKSPGNALGGFAFVWVDDWWQSGNPWEHDLTADEFNYEWHGLMSQGNGKNSPLMRQPRQAYFMYKEIWN